MKVLEIIPDHWEINADGPYDGLYVFLKNINSYNLNRKRNTQCEMSLTETTLLNTKVKLDEEKRKYVEIGATEPSLRKK